MFFFSYVSLASFENNVTPFLVLRRFRMKLVKCYVKQITKVKGLECEVCLGCNVNAKRTVPICNTRFLFDNG